MRVPPPPNPLSVVLIWISAIFMAIKQGVESWPAASEALPFMSLGWLSFVPLVLLLVAASLTIVRSPHALPPKVNAAPTEESKPKPDYYAIRHAIHAIKQVRSGILEAVNSRGNRRVELKLHDVRAALLTAYRQFDLPRLPSEDEMRVELLNAERYIELVLPYLEERHFDEARDQARGFVDNLNARREKASGKAY